MSAYPFDLTELSNIIHKDTPDTNVEDFIADSNIVDNRMNEKRKQLEDEQFKQIYITKMCELFRFKNLEETKDAYNMLIERFSN